MIEEKLARLADLQAYVDVIRGRYAELRKQIIPKEIQEQLADIAAEEQEELAAAQEGIASLKADIEAEVIACGRTVKSPHLYAVYMKGRTIWNTKALERYAEDHPEVLDFRKLGNPSVSIRNV